MSDERKIEDLGGTDREAQDTGEPDVDGHDVEGHWDDLDQKNMDDLGTDKSMDDLGTDKSMDDLGT